jgi:hypothetical protein
MEQWALVVGNSLLLAVALAGGVVTLVRLAPVSRRAMSLAAAGCLAFVLGAGLDLLWWLVVFPDAVQTGDAASLRAVADLGVLVNQVLIAAGIALLLVAVHVGRVGLPAGRRARVRGVPSEVSAGAAPFDGRSGSGASGNGMPSAGARRADGRAARDAAPGGGWTPPQRAQPADWSHMSGVWSMPPGAFDPPPPNSSGR